MSYLTMTHSKIRQLPDLKVFVDFSINSLTYLVYKRNKAKTNFAVKKIVLQSYLHTSANAK